MQGQYVRFLGEVARRAPVERIYQPYHAVIAAYDTGVENEYDHLTLLN